MTREISCEQPSSDLQNLLHDNLRLGDIVYRPIADLRSYRRKLKTHSEDTILALLASLRAFGMVMPLPIDRDGVIIDGEALLEAARRFGMASVPTVMLDHLSSHQVQLLRLALKKLAMRSDWNRAELKLELAELLVVDDEITLDVTGFSMVEVDGIISDEPEAEAPEALPEVLLADQPVAQLGDLWQLGRHRVFCGSSLEEASFDLLMRTESARIVLTDHPYNVKIKGHVSGHGQKVHREFVQGSGELSQDEFQTFLIDSMRLMSSYCMDGGLLYMFMDWQHGGEMYRAIDANGLKLINLAVWVKSQGSNAAFLRPQHELCFIAKTGTSPYLNCVQMGRHGRNRTNCWQFPGMNSFGKDRAELLAMHPTVKNLDMICEAIRDSTHRNEIVLDGFLGSGTTLIAAERTGRICRGIELDPLYVDCIIRRWEKMTGQQARLGDDGATFAEVAVARAAEPEQFEPIPTPRARVRIRPALAA
jgi:DNA modification methylase